MKYCILASLTVLSVTGCKPANQSFENWSKDSSSYILSTLSKDRSGYQFDFVYQGKNWDVKQSGKLDVKFQALESPKESLGSFSNDGKPTTTSPRYLVKVVAPEKKINCSASVKSLDGLLPLVCTGDTIDRLVPEDQGDCKAGHSQVTLVKTYGVEFDDNKEVQILVNSVDKDSSYFEQMISLNGTSTKDSSKASIVDYLVFENGKLVTPSYIIKKEGDRQLLYLIQADTSDQTAPTYLIATIEGSGSKVDNLGRIAYKTKVSKNICVGKLKDGSNLQEGSFLFLPSVSRN
jgi:hypothetical protein